MIKKHKKHWALVVGKSVIPMLVIYVMGLLVTYAGPINYFLLFFWLSPLFHFLGGVSVAIGLYMMYSGFRTRWKLKISPRWLFALCFVAMVGLVGILWEVYEMVLNIIFSTSEHQPNVADTMADLLMDLIGGGVVYLFIWLIRKPTWLK